MKKIYSVILLFSFLVGTLQPILPMIEYQLYEGGIIKLISVDGDNAESHCEMMGYALDNCRTQVADQDQNLLDVDYYPIAPEFTPTSQITIFPNKSRFYISVAKNVISPTFLPIPPPPRLS